MRKVIFLGLIIGISISLNAQANDVGELTLRILPGYIYQTCIRTLITGPGSTAPYWVEERVVLGEIQQEVINWSHGDISWDELREYLLSPELEEKAPRAGSCYAKSVYENLIDHGTGGGFYSEFSEDRARSSFDLGNLPQLSMQFFATLVAPIKTLELFCKHEPSQLEIDRLEEVDYWVQEIKQNESGMWTIIVSAPGNLYVHTSTCIGNFADFVFGATEFEGSDNEKVINSFINDESKISIFMSWPEFSELYQWYGNGVNFDVDSVKDSMSTIDFTAVLNLAIPVSNDYVDIVGSLENAGYTVIDLVEGNDYQILVKAPLSVFLAGDLLPDERYKGLSELPFVQDSQCWDIERMPEEGEGESSLDTRYGVESQGHALWL